MGLFSLFKKHTGKLLEEYFGRLRDTEMKKKCKGCRALQKKLLGIGYYCGLNHPIKVTSEIDGIPVEYKPLEECEKQKQLQVIALCT